MRTVARGIAALALVAGCAIQRPGETSPKSLRDVLTRQEIMQSTGTELDLFQAIRSLRPHFLEAPPGVRSRASTASRPTAVFVDRVRQGGLDALRSLPSSAVDEVRYLDPTASQSEFGPSASGGAVMVKLYKPSKDPDSSSL